MKKQNKYLSLLVLTDLYLVVCIRRTLLSITLFHVVVKLLELPCSRSVSPSPCCCCAALSQDSPANAKAALKTLLPPRPSDSNSGLLLSPIGL